MENESPNHRNRRQRKQRGPTKTVASFEKPGNRSTLHASDLRPSRQREVHDRAHPRHSPYEDTRNPSGEGDTYSPAAIDIELATSPAIPAIKTACFEADA